MPFSTQWPVWRFAPPSFDRTATDSLLGSDTATRTLTFARTTTDTLLGSDTATRTLTLARSASDALLDTDTATRTLTLVGSATDTLLGSDTAAGLLVFARSASDTLLGADTAAGLLVLGRSTTDTLLGADTATRALVFARATTDTLLGGDTAVGERLYDPMDLAVDVTVPGTATLTWTASTTPGVVDYIVFRRTPTTGDPFDPYSETPIATGITDTDYDDAGLAADTYEWQVFGRIPV